LVAFLLLILASGCSRAPQRTTVTQPSRAVDDTVVSVTEMLRQGADDVAWRTYVQQINHYLAGHPSAQTHHLSQDEKDFLQKPPSPDQSEIDELDSLAFPPLDAHFLDQAFLVRDAVGGLNPDGLAPLERVTKAFEWVIREVRLQPGDGITVPPLLVLRRG